MELPRKDMEIPRKGYGDNLVKDIEILRKGYGDT